VSVKRLTIMTMLYAARGTLVFLLISPCAGVAETPNPTPEPTIAPTPRPTFDECTSDYQCAHGEACKRGKCKVTCASRFPTDAACGDGKRINFAERTWQSEEGVPQRMVDEEKCCQDLKDGDLFVAAPYHNCDGDAFLTTPEECEQARIEFEMRYGMRLSFHGMESMEWGDESELVVTKSYDDPSLVDVGEFSKPFDNDALSLAAKGCQLFLGNSKDGLIMFNENGFADFTPDWGNQRLVCKTKECTADADCVGANVCSDKRCKACHEFSEESCPSQCQWESKSFPFTGKGECTEKCDQYDHASRCPQGRCHWDGDTCQDSCARKDGKNDCETISATYSCFWDGEQCVDQVFVGLGINTMAGEGEPSSDSSMDCGFHMQDIDDIVKCKEACFTLGQNMEWIDASPYERADILNGCLVNNEGTACLFNEWPSAFKPDGNFVWSEYGVGNIVNSHLTGWYYPMCKQNMCTCKNGHGAIGVEQGCGEHGAAVCHLCDMVTVGEHPYLLDPVFHNCEKTEDWIMFMDNAQCAEDRSEDLSKQINTRYGEDISQDAQSEGIPGNADLKQCLDTSQSDPKCNDIYVSTNIPKVSVAPGRRRGQSCYCLGKQTGHDRGQSHAPQCAPTKYAPWSDYVATQYSLRHACHAFRTSLTCPYAYCEWSARGEPYTTGDHYHEGCFEAQTRLCPATFPVCWHTGNCVSEECSSRNSCERILNKDYIDGNGNGRGKCNGDHQACTTEDGASVFSYGPSIDEFEPTESIGLEMRSSMGYRPKDAGHACKFPFIHKGMMYHSCTVAGIRNFKDRSALRNQERAWCATGTSQRDWGFCDMDSSPTCSKTPPVACSIDNDCEPNVPYCVTGLCQKSGWVVAMRQALCSNMVDVLTDWRARVTLNQCMKMVGADANCGNFLVYSEEDVVTPSRGMAAGDDELLYREEMREEFENQRKDAERQKEHLAGNIQYGSYCGCVPIGESCVRIPLKSIYPLVYRYDDDDMVPTRAFQSIGMFADQDAGTLQETSYHEMTIFKQASCPDDSSSWFYKENRKNCDWVASLPKDRCHVKGNLDGQRVYASKACPTTCGGCGQCLNDAKWRLRNRNRQDWQGDAYGGRIPTQNRNYEDDDVQDYEDSWKDGTFSLFPTDGRGCMWVGKKRSRCNRYGRDAFGHRVSAREACCKACSKFFDEGRRLSNDVVV